MLCNMPGDQGFVSISVIDSLVTGCESAAFHLRYGFTRAYANVVTNRPAGDALNWMMDDNRLAFALCGGIGADGHIAAQFLGSRLLDWLWSLADSQEETQETIAGRLNWNLTTWAERGQELIMAARLDEKLDEDGRAQQLELRTTRGGESTFLCGALTAREDGLFECIFAWAGENILRCYDGNNDLVQFEPLRSPFNRWSTILGKRGSVNLVRLGPEFGVRRVLACSDGLASLSAELPGMTAPRAQRAIQELFLSPHSDDMAFLDVWQSAHPLASRWDAGRPSSQVRQPRPRLQFNQNLLDSGGLLVWNQPADVVYAIVEADGQDTVRCIYAGREPQCRLPSWPTGERYRVGLYAPERMVWSEWWPPDGNLESQDAVDPVEEIEEQQPAEPPVVETVAAAEEIEEEPVSERPSSLVPFTEELLRSQEAAEPDIEAEPTQEIRFEPEEVISRLLETPPPPAESPEIVRPLWQEYDRTEPGEITRPVAPLEPRAQPERVEIPIRPAQPQRPAPAPESIEENAAATQPVRPLEEKPAQEEPTRLPQRLGDWLKNRLAQPQPRPAPAAEPEKRVYTCNTFEEMYVIIARHLQSQNVRLQRLRLEQRIESSNEYRNVDSRKTTEIYSLNITKGPDYRLMIWGAKEEALTAYITFERQKWNIKITFEPLQRPGNSGEKLP